MAMYNLKEMLIEKCDIYYGENLISKEKILEEYAKFFWETIVTQENSVSYVFHTGSVCFDFVSTVVATVACFIYNAISNDDVITNLNPGDLIIYKNERYRWVSSEYEIDGKTYMVLEQDGKGKNGNSRKYLPPKLKYCIKPYYGESKITDGRGVRKKKSNREDFLSYTLGIPIEEVPSVMKIAVVIVADRNDFCEIYKNIRIVYAEKKQIRLPDIVPAAYYTSGGEEYQYGENPTKAEPVLKVVSSVTAARNIVLDRNLNKVVGLLITKTESLTENCSELADLLRRKCLKFIHVTEPMKTEIGEKLLDMYENTQVFACTKEYLKRNTHRVQSENSFTVELQRQVSNIIDNTISKILLAGGWNWKEYSQIQQELSIIRKSNWPDNFRDKFVLSAYGLLNLLTTANFSMEKLETVVEQEKINAVVAAPKDRISDLWSMAENAGAVQDSCIYIIDAIEEKYKELQYCSPKEERMYAYLEQHKDDKIAIIVPKAYYIDIFRLNSKLDYIIGKNIECVTANRFNVDAEYDAILVVGNIVGKKFDPLQCRTVRTIDILLYEHEEKIFNYRQKKRGNFEHSLNAKINNMGGENFDLSFVRIKNDMEIVDENSIQEFYDLKHYIESISTFDIRNLLMRVTSYDINTTVSEVKYIGTFITGEQIFFSKYYSAVVFDHEKGTVAEIAVDKLAPGNILVFTRRNNYTRSIVDDIYEKLVSTGRWSPEIIDASGKVSYWKKTLREYKDQGEFTYRYIAQRLRTVGCTIQEAAVRQWLVEDSHIVGPYKVETMEAIAKITQDTNLLRDAEGYVVACKIVRRKRKEILKLIEKAINDKLSGHIPSENSILKVVYDNVENLSEMYELEQVSELVNSINININLVNKPIMKTEVLL